MSPWTLVKLMVQHPPYSHTVFMPLSNLPKRKFLLLLLMSLASLRGVGAGLGLSIGACIPEKILIRGCGWGDLEDCRSGGNCQDSVKWKHRPGPLLLRLRGGGHNLGAHREDRLDTKEIKEQDRVKIARLAPVLPGMQLGGDDSQFRAVSVPTMRIGLVKKYWQEVSGPIVQHLKLQIRMNVQQSQIEMRTCAQTRDVGAVERAADFVSAFLLGFSVKDALALLRLENMYVRSFDVKEVKPLKGQHLARAIGRLAGTRGRTKLGIEQSTRTRIVIADDRVHILGSHDSIKQAQRVISDLIMGRPTAKANKKLHAIAGRLKKEF